MKTWCFKIHIEGIKTGQESELFRVVLALLYKRTSKERTKGNPPTPNNLAVYTLCPPTSNHSSCFDVPLDYPPIILHIHDSTPYQHIHTTSSNVTTPQTTSLSYQIIPPPSFNISTLCPRQSTSPPLRDTNSFCTPNPIPKYHAAHHL